MIDFDSLVLGPCMDAFAEPVVYQPAIGVPFQVTAVFDQAYRPVDSLSIEGIDPMHVTASRPCLGVRLSAFPVQPDQADLVTVRGVQYWVQEVLADGQGGARLTLNVVNGQR